MDNKKPLSLYAMWLEAQKRNALPSEWKLAHNFLTWATENGYKTEYGYKGEFTPDNLLVAIKTPRQISQKEIAEKFNISEELINGHDSEFDAYMEANGAQERLDNLIGNNTVVSLRQIAKDMNIDLGKATKKTEIAKLIVGARVFAGVDYGKADGDQTVIIEPEVNADAGE